MATTDSILSLIYGWNDGEDDWGTDGYNDFVKKMSTYMMLTVASASTTAQPGSPSDGDRYILPSSATGTDWAGNDDSIAVYVVDTWNFYALGTINKGFRAEVADINQIIRWTGSAWALDSTLYSQYANDTAAAAGTPAVPVGGYYINSSTGALQVRLT